MDQVYKVGLSLMEDLGVPRALTVAILLRYGEHKQLQQLRVDHLHYNSYRDLHKATVATEFFRKTALPGNADAMYVAARDGFLACEKANFSTNRRLSRFIHNYDLVAEDVAVMPFIKAWRKELKDVLGRIPDDLTPAFSGGATYADTGLYTTVPDKMTSVPTIYRETQCLTSLWWETSWGRACAYPSIGYPRVPLVVKGNVFFTVPKDGETDRGCCKEASIPLGYQLAVGKSLRPRLKRAYNIDLTNAKAWHQSLARKGSIDDSIATIDLSNASNMVCRALPELVLPNDWYELLNSLRAPMTRIDGRFHLLEMFSSMGNGFTFELETLLFQSLCVTVAKLRGCSEEEVSSIVTFGDDMIVPKSIADDCLAALRYFGFEPNIRKTFVTGPFRESCGGDFYMGLSVRGIYVKTLPTEPHHWIALANQLWTLPYGWSRRARLECFKHIPSAIRACQGPEELGDVVLHGPKQYWNAQKRVPRDEVVSTTMYRAYIPVGIPVDMSNWKPEVVHASALSGVDSAGPVPRGAVGYRLGWVARPGSSWLPMVR